MIIEWGQARSEQREDLSIEGEGRERILCSGSNIVSLGSKGMDWSISIIYNKTTYFNKPPQNGGWDGREHGEKESDFIF